MCPTCVKCVQIKGPEEEGQIINFGFLRLMIHLALQPNLASPMIMLIFQGAVFAVVDSEERSRNIQVSPDHLISSYFQSAPKQ